MSTPPFLDLPPEVTRGVIATERGQFAVLRAGDGASRCALLVPGFTGSKEDFVALLAPLAGSGTTVVALDLPGQFETPVGTGPCSLAGFAADVLSVAHALDGRPVHLLGHSFGGLVAREAVLAEPLAFTSLALMSSGPAALPAGQADRLRVFATVLAEHGLDVVWAAKRALEEQEGGTPPPDAAMEHFLTRRFLASAPASLLAMVDVLTSEPDRVAELAAVAPPTLVVYGSADDAWPPAVQAEMAARLGAEVAVLEGAGHSPNAERPVECAALLTDFWDSR